MTQPEGKTFTKVITTTAIDTIIHSLSLYSTVKMNTQCICFLLRLVVRSQMRQYNLTTHHALDLVLQACKEMPTSHMTYCFTIFLLVVMMLMII